MMRKPSSDPPRHVTPSGTGTFGMWLFLIALAMLFAASIFAFLLIVLRKPDRPDVQLPWPLWLSTGVMLASSFTVHKALAAVRRERQRPFRRWLDATLVLAVLFVVIQGPSLAALLQQHYAVFEQRVAVYGLVFTLILLHAMHVLGGLVPLAVVAWQAVKNRYDHEHYGPVKYVAMYWHFLDGVWLVLFVVLLLAA